MWRGRHLRQAPDRPAGRDLVGEKRLCLHQRQKAERALHQAGPPRQRDALRADDPQGDVFHDGRQPGRVLRLSRLGDGAEKEPDRRGVCDLLASESHLDLLRLRLVRAGGAWDAPAAGKNQAPGSIQENRSPLGFTPGPEGAVLMHRIIQDLEQRQLRGDRPRFKPGDTVRVPFQVIESQLRRVQVFEGIVIKRQGAGVRETFTVRKQSFGVGVERTFPLHSPKIDKIEVAAIGDVSRAKLYYLRGKVGKKARVREVQRRGPLSSADAVAAGAGDGAQPETDAGIADEPEPPQPDAVAAEEPEGDQPAAAEEPADEGSEAEAKEAGA